MPDDSNSEDIKLLSDLVDLKELELLLTQFTLATGLGVRLTDPQGNPIINPKNSIYETPLCAMIHNNEKGEIQCRKNIRKAGEEAHRWGEPFFFNCHLGLMEWAVPIVVEDKLLGILVCGQVLIQDMDDLIYSDVIKTTGEYGMDYMEVDSALEKVPVLSGERVRAAAELLYISVGQLVRLSHETLQQRRELNEQQANLAEQIVGGKNRRFPGLYPIDKERELIATVRLGDLVRAKEILNEILGAIFVYETGRPEMLKARLLELMVMLSRAAVEAGADLEAILGANFNHISELAHLNGQEELCIWILGVLNQFTTQVYKTRNAERIKLISSALEYIRKYYQNPITLEDVGRSVHRSPTYIGRILREEFGVPFHAYLNRTRIEAAKKLLADPQRSIVDISATVGFSDQSYFGKQFKQLTGYTPAFYRKIVI